MRFRCASGRRSSLPTLTVLAAALVLFGAAASAGALEQEYRVGEGDLLKITVYDNPDLDTQARVSGEGRISFPLIGEVQVDGLTTVQVQERIAGRLRDGYVKKPQVSVFIQEYKSKKVTALGEFVKPGLVELRGNATLMEVISNAGGVTANAGESLVIKRKVLKTGATAGEEETIVVPLAEFLEGKTGGGQPVMVVDGDSIYVARAAFVFVSGAVKTPGIYKITEGLTVLKAITLAGGFTQRASKGRVSVIRKSPEGEQNLPARLEDPVQPDDVVVVPESLF